MNTRDCLLFSSVFQCEFFAVFLFFMVAICILRNGNLIFVRQNGWNTLRPEIFIVKFETYNVVAFLYLVMTISLSLVVRATEHWLSRHRN